VDSSELCRECRAPVQRGSKFCSACGHAVGVGTLEGERRQLTVLFCDVVGSTALSERLDPEDLRDLLNGYQRVCRDAILRYEGHVSQFLGDGVLAYFGYPRAHEDDAVRATRAALSILEAVKLVNQGIGKRLHSEIHVRAGLDSGVAVIGEVGPSGGQERLAVGEAVNLAARIEAFADADTVLLSASTARLVGGHFELQSLQAQPLKGFSRPVELFRVVRPTGARTKFEAAARGKLTPHVGRERELADLGTAWNDVQRGADRVIVVRGEAGIGKSRLVHQFRNAMLDEAVTVLECFCSPLTQATALAPVIEMLQARIVERAEGQTTPQAKLEALGSMLGEHSRFGADALPLVAALVSIPGADDTPLRELSAVRRRARTLEILRAWIGWSAERVPLAFLVEDVHWADPSTLDFLDLIVREPPGGRTFLCVTGRPEFLVRWSQPHVRAIELSRLSGDEVEAIVTHVTGGRVLPSVVTKRITERSEGVPLFVEEVTKAVLESGAVRLDVDRYELAGSFDEQLLPSTVHESLVARFDRLGGSRRIAQLGAAIGREFTYTLIRAVAEIKDDELTRHLDNLSGSELAFAQGSPPNSVYGFKHALIQDAIYATLLKSERVRVHERIFAALVKTFPETVAARPEMAAYHAKNAGRREAAVPLLRDAGVQALARTAPAEAVLHLRHGIELVDALEEPARTSMELELQAAIGPAYMATVGWAAPEVERACARLRDLASATADGTKLFQAMWGLWTVDFLRGRLGPALDVSRQVLKMAQDAGDPLLRVLGHHAAGYTHFFRAEYDDALRHAQEGLALFDIGRERQIAAIFQFSSSCAMWNAQAEAQQILGLARQAAESLRQWRRLIEILAHAPSRAYSLVQQCHFFYAQGHVDEVHRLAMEARSLSVAEGFALWVPITDIFLAWVSARRGEHPAAAVENLRAAKARVDQTLTHVRELEFTSMLAETLLLANRPEEVSWAVEAALQVTRPGMLGHYEAELFRFQGDAAGVMRDREGAVASYRSAIDSAQRTGAKVLEERATSALEQLGR
jgi:class 3 adenylate cyclase